MLYLVIVLSKERCEEKETEKGAAERLLLETKYDPVKKLKPSHISQI